MTVIDPAAAFITFLEADSDVTAQTTAIYGPNGLPMGTDMPAKAIVVLPDGWAPPSTEDVELRARLLVHCYGTSPATATDVFQAVFDAAHAAKRKDIDVGTGVGSGAAYNNRMLIARLASGPRPDVDPLREWPRVTARFEAVFVRDELDSY